jgi:hypothetical protein
MTRFLFSVWRLRVSWRGAPSLTRGWICNLLIQFLLGLARAHFWAEVPQNSRPYFTVSFEIPPTWRARSPYLYSPGTGWPIYTTGYWVSFSSPLTTRRAMVEVFYPASTRTTRSRYVALARTAKKKNIFHYCVFFRCRGSSLSTEMVGNIIIHHPGLVQYASSSLSHNGIVSSSPPPPPKKLLLYTDVTWHRIFASQYFKLLPPRTI